MCVSLSDFEQGHLTEGALEYRALVGHRDRALDKGRTWASLREANCRLVSKLSPDEAGPAQLTCDQLWQKMCEAEDNAKQTWTAVENHMLNWIHTRVRDTNDLLAAPQRHWATPILFLIHLHARRTLGDFFVVVR
jgi:hypothetical protein